MFSAPAPEVVLVANAIEICLLLVGVALLWRWVVSPAARAAARSTPPALAPWQPTPSDFLLYLVAIACCSFAGSAVVGLIAARFTPSPDARLILGTAGLQIGLMAAALLLPLHAGKGPFSLASLRGGIATFLIALPLVTATMLLWTRALTLFGLPTDNQDIVRLFLEARQHRLLVLMVILPTVVAPIGEELLFRGTIFRFLRSTRLPRGVVLALPAVVFATFHFSLVAFAPLLVLAIVFALAYERTGRIGTTIVAHALFNLHTVVFLLAGVSS